MCLRASSVARSRRWAVTGDAALWRDCARVGKAVQVASADPLYGTMALIITFLIWMWMSNTAILLGPEFAATRVARPGGRHAFGGVSKNDDGLSGPLASKSRSRPWSCAPEEHR